MTGKQERSQPKDIVDYDVGHQLVIERRNHILRRPVYHTINAMVATIACLVSALTFYQSMFITPVKEYIPTTSADTAVVPIDVFLPLIPTPNQDISPGETFNEEQSVAILKTYISDALRDCFAMNYINFPDVMSRCKQLHLDSESSTPDDYESLLSRSGIVGLLQKYKTASSVVIEPSSISLIESGTVSYPLPLAPEIIRERFVWVFELNMSLTLLNLNAKTPTRWRIEVVRESSFNKQLAASIFKIITLD
ncbi:TPA: hypothetical protein I7117_14875 [Vibrio vulnificus]|uniref:hypothetical protein n=1 Tax=Vibrio navarrensis TaxID=29495 RepID=UPI0018DE6F51|nr:hypothetical protein [Vibrio navarrensis]MBH9739947.1 hypothetical protein [Vibrio navarrensis]HAS6100746.1 hypothetical protein [Vibrio vulnificus]